MTKQWTVNANGVDHQIEVKGTKLKIDGEEYKLKSSNWFIQLIDYKINFGDVACCLVIIGNKADLAVNGKYVGSGEPYEPIANIPVAVSVLAGISAVLGFLMNSWLGLCIGVLLGAAYFKLYLNKKNLTPIIIVFAIATVGQIALGFLVSFLLSSL